MKSAALIALIALAACRATPNSSLAPAHAVAYVGGQWFDGTRFTKKTMYVSDGLFSSAPQTVDSMVNISGSYVVPPFGDAHQHLIDPQIQATISEFLRDGIFYLKDQGNAPVMRRQIDRFLNNPQSIDYISANQSWTSPGGHPSEVIKRGAAGGGPMAAFIRDSLDPGLVNQVDTKEDIAARWPYFIAGKPDFVKVHLLRSEVFDKVRNDPRYEGNRGINPALIPEIVRLAHAAGLEVSAHVFTAFDFRAAIEAGVDQIAHIPGGRGPDSAPFLLSESDAKLARDRNVTVVTTVTQHGNRALADTLMRTQYTHNISLLRKYHVPILIGRDIPANPLDTTIGRTTAGEVAALARSGLFSNLELLRMWSVETPQRIFPKRRIGALSPGYEASFLVLRRNPLTDMSATKEITMRIKQGQLIKLGRQ